MRQTLKPAEIAVSVGSKSTPEPESAGQICMSPCCRRGRGSAVGESKHSPSAGQDGE